MPAAAGPAGQDSSAARSKTVARERAVGARCRHRGVCDAVAGGWHMVTSGCRGRAAVTGTGSPTPLDIAEEGGAVVVAVAVLGIHRHRDQGGQARVRGADTGKHPLGLIPVLLPHIVVGDAVVAGLGADREHGGVAGPVVQHGAEGFRRPGDGALGLFRIGHGEILIGRRPDRDHGLGFGFVGQFAAAVVDAMAFEELAQGIEVPVGHEHGRCGRGQGEGLPVRFHIRGFAFGPEADPLGRDRLRLQGRSPTGKGHDGQQDEKRRGKAHGCSPGCGLREDDRVICHVSPVHEGPRCGDSRTAGPPPSHHRNKRMVPN